MIIDFPKITDSIFKYIYFIVTNTNTQQPCPKAYYTSFFSHQHTKPSFLEHTAIIMV